MKNFQTGSQSVWWIRKVQGDQIPQNKAHFYAAWYKVCTTNYTVRYKVQTEIKTKYWDSYGKILLKELHRVT